MSFHSLRHSSISYKLVLTGGNVKAVQGDSGHAQVKMITERYGHIIDSCCKQCAQDFEEEFYKGMCKKPSDENQAAFCSRMEHSPPKKMDCRSISVWLAKRKEGETMNEIRKLSELAVYLKQAAETYSQCDYEQLHQKLRARCDQLIVEAFMDRHPGWSVVEGNAACMMCNWAFAEKAEDYDFSHCVLKNQHLFIFLFQARYKKEDSFCRCMNMADGSVSADIYMLIPHKAYEATPESMFLHELGHCVNVALTGDPEALPEDFTLIMKFIGADKIECDVPEFFTHCFAMSLLIEPELLSADPFKTVPQNHKQMFRTYFQHKIQNL